MRVIGPAASQTLADARRGFKDVPLAHVATLLPDGTPHVVPLWFVWLDDVSIVLSCRERSQVWANVVRDPRVAVEVERGRKWVEQAGLVIRGHAESVGPQEAMGKRALSAWFDKYREELAGAGFGSYVEQVPEPRMFQVRPTSVARWAHRNAADTPRG
jgi:PPOX class probable F420-dependent enzyme